jgi:hypothetical protein
VAMSRLVLYNLSMGIILNCFRLFYLEDEQNTLICFPPFLSSINSVNQIEQSLAASLREKNSVTQIGYSTMHYLLGIHNNW